MSSAYLAHHGIKGMKWGVRRYQNPDGSYTAEGKVRRKNGLTNLSDENKRRLKTAGKVALGVGTAAAVGYGAYKLGGRKALKKAFSKGSAHDLYKDLTDEEIQARIGRLDLELKLMDKTAQAYSNKGSKFAESIGTKVADKTLTALLAGTSYAVAKHYLEEALGYNIPRIDKK